MEKGEEAGTAFAHNYCHDFSLTARQCSTRALSLEPGLSIASAYGLLRALQLLRLQLPWFSYSFMPHIIQNQMNNESKHISV
jgi:hypothetical protein